VQELDLKRHRCQLGFWIGPGARGWGLGTEAIAAVLAGLHGVGLETVTIASAANNGAVHRIMEKLGGVEVRRGTQTLPNGREVDAVWYAHYAGA
jgi:RimJ/RimL family protein N-acetyltransferase